MDMVLLRLKGLCQYMKRKASEGDIAFQKMIHEGHLEHYQKTFNSFMNTEKNGFEDAKGLLKAKDQLGVYTTLITLK